MADGGRVRGRPRGREAIVNAVLPADALAELDVVISDVHRLCGDAASVLQWLAHGLIRNLLWCGVTLLCHYSHAKVMLL